MAFRTVRGLSGRDSSSLAPRAQALEDGESGKSVDRQALAALISLDRLKRQRPDHPVRLAFHQPLGDEQLLQLLALIERKVVLVGRPGLNEASAAFQPVRHCLLYTSDAADDLLCVDLGG